MNASVEIVKDLEFKALQIRKNLLRLCTREIIHIGGDLSIADVMTVLWQYQMKYNPKNPKDENRDRFVLSKGHASAVTSFCQAAIGCFSSEDVINEYKKTEDKIKILLVDDNEEERTLLTKKLGGISKLTIAKNGEEGLKRIRNKEKYDVLLIKESMEKLDAYQIIKKAKILEFVPDKIIVLADNKEEEEKLTINGYNAIFFDTSEQQFIKKLNNIIKK